MFTDEAFFWFGAVIHKTNFIGLKIAEYFLFSSEKGFGVVATWWIERSGFEPWPGAALRCVFGQVTLLSQCLSPPGV